MTQRVTINDVRRLMPHVAIALGVQHGLDVGGSFYRLALRKSAVGNFYYICLYCEALDDVQTTFTNRAGHDVQLDNTGEKLPGLLLRLRGIITGAAAAGVDVWNINDWEAKYTFRELHG